ncbi:PspC domain-containing protein [Streptomyces sp. TG1A-8]|uniref:PspC domain-containing protein n=1 Tax=Streptomyces sp. TG1A-8 TaxID=3051385 RepID=UPI00265C1F5F|nr:PspC domain-containing protein [Streptomyces sp. TG1A-8]MDO0926150.1 PspC domain-containing protein [Streptomyces sp. TG1A-8]
MTDHEHAATGPGPGSGPSPAPGTGPTDAASAAAGGTGAAGTAGAAGPGTKERWAGRAEGEQDPAPRRSAEGPGRFRRDRRYKTIAGVCAGLGRLTGADPVIFRITLAVLSATGGIGLLFYGFAWLFVPYEDEDEQENEVRKLLTGRVDGQALAAVLFALVGCGILLTMVRNGGVLTFAVVLSLLLAGAGYWSRHRGAPDSDPLAAQAAADAPPEAQAPPVATAYPSWWRDPIVKDGTHAGGTGYLWGPGEGRDFLSAVDVGMPTPWTHSGAPDAGAAASPRPRDPRWIGGWVFLTALVAGCLGTRMSWDTRPLGTSVQTGLACALAVFGLGIALSAFLGRTGAGSVFLAIVTAALLAGSAALPGDITTHWRHTSWRPATTAEVRPAYDFGTGVATLDLTGIRPAEGQTVTTDASVDAGQLKVIVPAGVRVRLSIDVGVGDIRLPGDDRKDVDVKPGRHQEVTLSPAGGEKAGVLTMGLQVGVGQVEVGRAAS